MTFIENLLENSPFLPPLGFTKLKVPFNFNRERQATIEEQYFAVRRGGAFIEDGGAEAVEASEYSSGKQHNSWERRRSRFEAHAYTYGGSSPRVGRRYFTEANRVKWFRKDRIIRVLVEQSEHTPLLPVSLSFSIPTFPFPRLLRILSRAQVFIRPYTRHYFPPFFPLDSSHDHPQIYISSGEEASSASVYRAHGPSAVVSTRHDLPLYILRFIYPLHNPDACTSLEEGK